MDIPAGRPIKECMGTANVDFKRLLPTLQEHSLTGYLAVDIMTSNGMEEGILLFNSGGVIAAEYVYVAKEHVVRGEDALKLVLNSLAGDGCLDIFELDEADMLTAREANRDSVLRYKPSAEEIISFLPDSFTETSIEVQKPVEIRADAIRASGGVSKEDVLKKYGISHPDERMVEKLLSEVVS